MKQNERILVYLVTGFLAVILVVAVFFGREGNAASKPNSDETVRGLGQILDQQPVPANPAVGGEAVDPGSGDPGSGDPGSGEAGDPEQGEPIGGAPQPEVTRPPLVASVPVAASARLTQLFGNSRRDRIVRFVKARAGDSLEALVRRWCGKRDPFLDEARSLNEELIILRLDQEVAVPWVDDEVVLAAYEARQPRLLTGADPDPATRSDVTPPAGNGPTFQVPGVGAGNDGAGKEQGGAVTAPAGSVEYVIQQNDSLWKIAAKRYGNRNAPRMIKEIMQLNGLTSDRLQPKQKLILPAGS